MGSNASHGVLETIFQEYTATGLLALTAAGLSATVILVYLIKRPPLNTQVKMWLLLGLGVLPIATAATGNLAGMHATRKARFCSSCHVMGAHSSDARDPFSQSLAARHSRNELFGDESCYTCHADYGLFGTAFTKLNGMVHVWHYVRTYHDMPLEDALTRLKLYRPYPNANCMHCHSTENELWSRVGDHRSTLQDVRDGKVSCASQGCHGYAHPFTKPEEPLPSAPQEEPPHE